MKEENHDIVYMLWFMSLVNAYNWRDGANDHKKIYIMKENLQRKKKYYELTEGKCPYIYRVAQKGAGPVSTYSCFSPLFGPFDKYDFYPAT